jgi:hypothetical protein
MGTTESHSISPSPWVVGSCCLPPSLPPVVPEEVSGSSPQMPRFRTRSVHVMFVLNNMQLQQAVIFVLQFFLVGIVPSVLHTLHLHIALTGRAQDEARSPSKSNVLSEIREQWLEK